MTHESPCNLERFHERVFDGEDRFTYRMLCRCCGRLLGRRRNYREADPICPRCDGLLRPVIASQLVLVAR